MNSPTVTLDKLIAQIKALFERELVNDPDDPETVLNDICFHVVEQVSGLDIHELHDLLDECRQRFPQSLHKAFDLWLSAGYPASYEYARLVVVVLGSTLDYELEAELLPEANQNKASFSPTIRLAIIVDEGSIPAELEPEFPASNIALELDEMPWPRLPVAGEVYMGPGGYGYDVRPVYFHANGDVTIYLAFDGAISEEAYIRALQCARAEGFVAWE
jgi:hypothetical protein